MKIENYMLYIVETYINNKLENLCEEQKVCGFNKGLQKDIEYLDSLTLNDYIKISNLVFDEELTTKIYDKIEKHLFN